MKIGDIVEVCINEKIEDATILQFSFQGLVLVRLADSWKFVHETDIKEKAK